MQSRKRRSIGNLYPRISYCRQSGTAASIWWSTTSVLHPKNLSSQGALGALDILPKIMTSPYMLDLESNSPTMWPSGIGPWTIVSWSHPSMTTFGPTKLSSFSKIWMTTPRSLWTPTSPSWGASRPRASRPRTVSGCSSNLREWGSSSTNKATTGLSYLKVLPYDDYFQTVICAFKLWYPIKYIKNME